MVRGPERPRDDGRMTGAGDSRGVPCDVHLRVTAGAETSARRCRPAARRPAACGGSRVLTST